MALKILIMQWPVFFAVAAVVFLTDCSGKKTVQKMPVQRKPPAVEKRPAEQEPGSVQEEQPQAELQGKEPSGAAPAADAGAQEELTISIPEQESKIEIVLPESAGLSPVIKAGEAKQEAENILAVINRLEETYENNDFEGWQSMLTPDYRKKYSDPVNLREEGWDAADLHSFFNLLVKTRRKGQIKTLKISRVVFANPNKAYVYVFFKNREFPEPQHTFVRINGKWLKGLREEEG